MKPVAMTCVVCTGQPLMSPLIRLAVYLKATKGIIPFQKSDRLHILLLYCNSSAVAWCARSIADLTSRFQRTEEAG